MQPTIIGNAALYTFSTFRPGKLVKVVRMTDSVPADWLESPKRYQRHSALRGDCVVKDCVEIATVEIVDERACMDLDWLPRWSVGARRGVAGYVFFYGFAPVTPNPG